MQNKKDCKKTEMKLKAQQMLEEEFDETEQDLIKAVQRTREIGLEEAIESYKLGDINYIALDYHSITAPEETLAYSVIDQVYGDISEIDRSTLERYFDYEAFGKDLSFDYTIDEETNLAILNY